MPRPIPLISPIPLSWERIRTLVGEQARTILEVGANQGTDTRHMLEAFPRATIHCFEPDPRAAKVHAESVRDRRVHLHRIAIGAANGKAEFHMSGGTRPDLPAAERARYPEGWDQSGSLRRPTGHLENYPWCTFRKSIQVEVRTLDAWSRKHAPETIDFLWADVQGAEGDLVAGGPETLARTRFMFCEYSERELYEGEPNLAQLLDLLPDFEVIHRLPSDVLMRNVRLAAT